MASGNLGSCADCARVKKLARVNADVRIVVFREGISVEVELEPDRTSDGTCVESSGGGSALK